jgi:hypothetical protein
MDEQGQTQEHHYVQKTGEHPNQENFVRDMMLLNRQTEIKTDIFLEAGWSGIGKAGINATLSAEYPSNKTAYFIVAYAPNNDKNNHQFEFFSQVVDVDDIDTVIYPNFSNTKKLREYQKPIYLYYLLKDGYYTKVDKPDRISEEQEKVA